MQRRVDTLLKKRIRLHIREDRRAVIINYLVMRLGGVHHSIHLNIMALTLGGLEPRDEKPLTM